MVKFAGYTPAELETTTRIIDRAYTMARQNGMTLDRFSLEMDLAATHALTPLDLDALLAADDFNFAHDVFGIMGHINRATGTMGDGFVPRFTHHDAE
jgi:hypothetical protein